MYEGAVLALRLNTSTQFHNDRLSVPGQAILDGQLSLSGNGLAAGNTYTIVTATGGISGTFDQPPGGYFVNGLAAILTYTPTSVNVTLVPEPSMIASAGAVLLAVRRRRLHRVQR
jgi:hypothetical protein